jgi:multidrug efflux pump subunit AcrB
MVNLNPRLIPAKGLSPSDVLTALGKEQFILPGGITKIGQLEYQVEVNADLKKVSEYNDLPIKRVGNTIIYLRDLAKVSDGFAPQTNIVRQDGKRGALVTVLKAGDASPSMSSGVGGRSCQGSLKRFLPN